MPELIALKALKYPRAIAVGERFEVDARSAKVLKAAKRAKDAPVKRQRQQLADGQYGRRDMLAVEP